MITSNETYMLDTGLRFETPAVLCCWFSPEKYSFHFLKSRANMHTEFVTFCSESPLTSTVYCWMNKNLQIQCKKLYTTHQTSSVKLLLMHTTNLTKTLQKSSLYFNKCTLLSFFQISYAMSITST